jgi:hypothetical protein
MACNCRFKSASTAKKKKGSWITSSHATKTCSHSGGDPFKNGSLSASAYHVTSARAGAGNHFEGSKI